MLAAVMIELENVIVETRILRAEALRQSLRAIGVAVDAAALTRDFTGLMPRQRAEALLGAQCEFADETELDLLVLRAERAFTERVTAGITLVAGARECLTALHGDARLAIVTRASRRVVELALGLAELEELFECVVTPEDARATKPAPALHQLALARLAQRRPVVPTECLALEDGIAGVRAAKRAGLRCVAVGAIPPGEAMEASADAWLPSLAGQNEQTLAALLRSGEESRS